MNHTNLDSFVSIPLSIDLFIQFARRYPGGFNSVIEQIAWDFLDRTADDFQGQEERSGIYWDSLFLPDGTLVRTKHYDEYKEATIAEGKIAWEDENYPSMSKLACAMRGYTSNNAWRVLEIKRPTDSKWQRADLIRG
jgi:hypothetical protein